MINGGEGVRSLLHTRPSAEIYTHQRTDDLAILVTHQLAALTGVSLGFFRFLFHTKTNDKSLRKTSAFHGLLTIEKAVPKKYSVLIPKVRHSCTKGAA